MICRECGQPTEHPHDTLRKVTNDDLCLRCSLNAFQRHARRELKGMGYHHLMKQDHEKR